MNISYYSLSCYGCGSVYNIFSHHKWNALKNLIVIMITLWEHEHQNSMNSSQSQQHSGWCQIKTFRIKILFPYQLNCMNLCWEAHSKNHFDGFYVSICLPLLHIPGCFVIRYVRRIKWLYSFSIHTKLHYNLMTICCTYNVNNSPCHALLLPFMCIQICNFLQWIYYYSVIMAVRTRIWGFILFYAECGENSC